MLQNKFPIIYQKSKFVKQGHKSLNFAPIINTILFLIPLKLWQSIYILWFHLTNQHMHYIDVKIDQVLMWCKLCKMGSECIIIGIYVSIIR